MTTRTRAGVLLADGLFASWIDPSDHLSAHDAKVAAFRTIRRLGQDGCVRRVADEYGDHPDAAAARMAWALDLVGAG